MIIRNEEITFYDYYKKWVDVYKKDAVKLVTFKKYKLAMRWLEKLAPDLKIKDLTRTKYQGLLNEYAKTHERQTTADFHHLLKGSILDALDEKLIDYDPTRKIVIKGKTPTIKRTKYLNQFQLQTLISNLKMGSEIDNNWLILLIAKTGIRFSEALGLTPKDFDFLSQSISINKTWDYKYSNSFAETKNKASVRKVQADWSLMMKFSELVKNMPEDKPIFINEKVYNSTVNNLLQRYCKELKIPIITIHGLRHTHASILLSAGVSIGSIARRLGHANMATTQKTYLHIIQELESTDIDLIMRAVSSL